MIILCLIALLLPLFFFNKKPFAFYICFISTSQEQDKWYINSGKNFETNWHEKAIERQVNRISFLHRLLCPHKNYYFMLHFWMLWYFCNQGEWSWRRWNFYLHFTYCIFPVIYRHMLLRMQRALRAHTAQQRRQKAFEEQQQKWLARQNEELMSMLAVTSILFRLR